MRKHLMGLTRGMLVGAALLLAGAGWAATGTTPVQAAGGGGSADEYAKKSDLGFQWGGDVRFRLDTRAPNHMVADPRFRVRLRIGATGEFGDSAFWGFRLATGTGDPVSRNQTLAGGDANGGSMIGIDSAYVGFRPVAPLAIMVGKMPSPYWACQGLFDDDLTPEGATLSWKIHPGKKGDTVRDVNLMTGFYWLRESRAITFDPFAVLSQVRATFGPVQTGVGFYYYAGLNKLTAAGMPAWGNPTNLGSQVIAGAYGQPRMFVVHGRAAGGFEVGSFPVNVSGDLYYNASTTWIPNTAEKLGWEVQVNMPKAGKWNGRYANLMIRGAESGEWSTFSGWSDSDLGEMSGYRAGIHAKYTVPVAKNVDLGASYFHYDQRTPYTGGSMSTHRFMLDLMGKF